MAGTDKAWSLTQIFNRVFNEVTNRLKVEGTLDTQTLPVGYDAYRATDETDDLDADEEGLLSFENSDSERDLRIQQVYLDGSGEIRAELFVTTAGTPAGAKASLGFVSFSPAGSGHVRIKPSVQLAIPPGQYLVAVVVNRNAGEARAIYGTAEGILVPDA